MLLFLFACVFEDDPLPVLPRPQGSASTTSGEEDDDYYEEAPLETVESSEGATGSNAAPIVGTGRRPARTPDHGRRPARFRQPQGP